MNHKHAEPEITVITDNDTIQLPSMAICQLFDRYAIVSASRGEITAAITADTDTSIVLTGNTRLEIIIAPSAWVDAPPLVTRWIAGERGLVPGDYLIDDELQARAAHAILAVQAANTDA